MSVDSNGCLDLTVSEDLDKVCLCSEPCSFEIVNIHFTLTESVDGSDIDCLILYTCRVLETELRKDSLKRHLTSFETDLMLVSGACLSTLGTTGGCAALT